MLRRFIEDRRGNIALLYGLAAVPLLGFAGATLDYSRAADFRTFIHREADLAATAIASSDAPNTQAILDELKEFIAAGGETEGEAAARG